MRENCQVLKEEVWLMRGSLKGRKCSSILASRGIFNGKIQTPPVLLARKHRPKHSVTVFDAMVERN